MKKMLLSLIGSFFLMLSIAQNVGIGTNTPNASASLDISATDKGLLPPRVALASLTDVATIASPATGLLVFNTATAGVAPNNVVPGYYYYTGLAWYKISNPGSAAGDMQYWNGTQWVLIPAGVTGATLTICGGVPQWGPCGAGSAPTVTTTAFTNLTANTVSTGGNVTSDGGAAVTARGVCYAITTAPTIANTVVNSGTGVGVFTTNINSLLPSTTYFARAFATNSVNTAYGNEITFTTPAASEGTVTTTSAFGIGANSASSGGNVTSNGGGIISARGIVYNTATLPTLSNTVITDPSVTTGTFTANLTGLVTGQTYYVRAYVTNNIGTAYGNEISFTTAAAGSFAATYTFDSVKTTSGFLDPTPLPTATGMTFGQFSAVGLGTGGAPVSNPNASFRFSFTNWSLGATTGSDAFTSAIDSTDKYYQVTLTPNGVPSFNLDSLNFTFQRSGTGVRQAFVRSSLDGYTTNLAASVPAGSTTLSVVATNKFQTTDANTAASPGCKLTLGSAPFLNISGPVTFRFYGINAEGTGGTFSVDNVVFSGKTN
ncbi:MAG: hypothetical protein ACOYKE_06350 [Ferruginibacter sp.]